MSGLVAGTAICSTHVSGLMAVANATMLLSDVMIRRKPGGVDYRGVFTPDYASSLFVQVV